MNNLLIKAKEIGNHRISIYYDTDAGCPCTDWDMAACYLWEYNDRYHHWLSDACDWKKVFGNIANNRYSLVDALQELIRDYVNWKDLLNYFKKGKVDNYRLRYDRSDKCWYLEYWSDWKGKEDGGEWVECLFAAPSDLYDGDLTSEFIEDLEQDDLLQILNDLGKDIVVKEWSSSGYCQGDYVYGVAFCTKERYAKMVNTDTTDWKAKVNKLIDGEIECIGMWMWGDVKGYVLEKKVSFTKRFHEKGREDEEDSEWEEIDSCWGYFMETDELINEVISEHNLKEAA